MPRQPNQVTPFKKEDKRFSSFNKFLLRERLGIKQILQESDIEEFKKDGADVQNLQPSPTPKLLMMLT